MMETSIIRFWILDFGFRIGEPQSEGEGREVGTRGLAAGARNSRTNRKEEEAQKHSGEEERPGENTRRPSVVKAPVAEGVAVVDRQKARVAQGRRGDAAAVPEMGLRPIEKFPRAGKAGAQIHVFEPGRDEAGVEAVEDSERALANRQGRGGGLLDLERAVPVAIRIPPAAAPAVVRSKRVHEEQLASVGREARKPTQLKRELVFVVGGSERSGDFGFQVLDCGFAVNR